MGYDDDAELAFAEAERWAEDAWLRDAEYDPRQLAETEAEDEF